MYQLTIETSNREFKVEKKIKTLKKVKRACCKVIKKGFYADRDDYYYPGCAIERIKIEDDRW